MKVDFHFHSSFSDGAHSLTELIEMAKANEVQLLSLTDHDSIAGYPQFQKLASSQGMQVICGIECSVTWNRQELHIIGLGINANHQRLSHYLEMQQKKRLERAQTIACRLESMGFKDCYTKVLEWAGHLNISRTHFANLLVNHYGIKDKKTVFRDYLGSRGAAYYPSQWTNIEETVAVIHASGGAAVLAHPLHYQLSTAQLKGLLRTFKAAKGDGIEIISGFQSLKDTHRIAQLSRDFNLLASTGSDFHYLAPYRATIGAQALLPDYVCPIWRHEAFQSAGLLLE
jgi:3',5'-nucleoside bisphosphate phosphatase